MKLSLTQQLLLDIEQIPIQSQDLARAGLHVLDWIGCAMLGQKGDVAKVYRNLANCDTDDNFCHFIGQSNKLVGGWQNAIQHNGALGNVLEMDDVHRQSILHPGPIVIPTALALTEHLQLQTKDFLKAVIVGYEMTIRIGERIGRSHYKHFHNTSTCGAFGAAMAAASLLKLSSEQTIWALGNAGSRTGGVWQMRNENVMTKQWHNAEAARSGAMAAMLAKEGLTGPAFILDGPQGIFNAMSHDADFKPVNAAKKTWKMYDCSFKPWPACRHAHPAIDATLKLQQVHKLIVNDIKAVHIFGYQDAIVFCDNPTPTTCLQAKFSLQHAVASVLLHGQPTLAHYDEATLDQPDIVKLRNIIQASVDNNIETMFPAHYGARIEITLNNGKVLKHAITDTLGDPEQPMSELEIFRKLQDLLSAAGIKQSRIEQLNHFDWLLNQPITNLAQYITQEKNA